jgi:hypothetical protein
MYSSSWKDGFLEIFLEYDWDFKKKMLQALQNYDNSAMIFVGNTLEDN